MFQKCERQFKNKKKTTTLLVWCKENVITLEKKKYSGSFGSRRKDLLEHVWACDRTLT